MTISMYGMSVPVFTRMLTNLLAIMDKAEAYAADRKFDTLVLSEARLAPDMIPFRGQIMIATDHVKGCVSRLAGKEVPSWPDTEKTFDELRARIQKALDLLSTVQASDLDGSEDRQITLKLGGNEVTMDGETYLTQRALPNFYFHVTTAYSILRNNGIPIGKRDYIG
ncbi:hypothetical protein WH87_07845 [Devosia epidermidihirudinis]|uniref:DUF1993 domain-containing protein n=1 Tax=Devosia epidermidihirudinis TaxID=1293439 RepID=A0A0F5QFK9_9HYPH|nr:DUF1993 domain-containing protein [Devosia epidermidihirudinis]KKC38804.1 hypothetical protein WH87_07845 [Devosia epidermidihirudinis]